MWFKFIGIFELRKWESSHCENKCNGRSGIKPLKTKRRLLYLKTQSVLRS